MKTTRQKPICSYCGSEDISFNANANWDSNLQEYVLNGSSSKADCEYCEKQTPVEWSEVGFIDVTDRERNTILAGLRALQAFRSLNPDTTYAGDQLDALNAIATNAGIDLALPDHCIGLLCDKINFGSEVTA